MATLAQFSRNIRKRGSEIENNSVTLTRRVTKRALRALVRATPVHTGEARSNWRVSLGVRTFATIPPFFPGKNLGINENRNARAAIAAGDAVLDRLRAGAGRRLTTAVFITNNARHIEILNNGHSAQAPAGFIEIALLEARAEISQFRLLRR